MKNKFNITLFYEKSEKPYFGISKCRHAITEKFENVSGKDVPNLLIDALDVPFDYDQTGRVAVEPSIERLKENGFLGLDLAFDEDWAKREVARGKKAKAAYDKLVDFANNPTFYGPFRTNVDRNTSVMIQLV